MSNMTNQLVISEDNSYSINHTSENFHAHVISNEDRVFVLVPVITSDSKHTLCETEHGQKRHKRTFTTFLEEYIARRQECRHLQRTASNEDVILLCQITGTETC